MTLKDVFQIVYYVTHNKCNISDIINKKIIDIKVKRNTIRNILIQTKINLEDT